MAASDTQFLSHEDLQSQLLSMLVRFDGFCRSHGLKYSVWAGTLLGAVRHKGFIPWDDDVDVGMGRPELERFIALVDVFHEETGLDVVGYLGVPLEEAPLVKIIDKQVMTKPRQELRDTYLWIDLNPADAMPESAEELELLCRTERFWRLALSVVSSTVSSGRTPLRRLVKALCIPLRPSLAYRRLVSRKLTRNALALPYGSTDYVGAVTWGIAETRERVHFASFEQSVELEFCGHSVMAMGCWEEYLQNIYGPYFMQMPPMEYRNTHLMRAWRVSSGRS